MNLQSFLQKNSRMILVFVGLFLVAVVGSWFLFSYVIKMTPAVNPVLGNGVGGARSKINQNAPKTESCPLNGQMYTTEEKAIWSGRRPITAMVENNIEARPING